MSRSQAVVPSAPTYGVAFPTTCLPGEGRLDSSIHPMHGLSKSNTVHPGDEEFPREEGKYLTPGRELVPLQIIATIDMCLRPRRFTGIH